MADQEAADPSPTARGLLSAFLNVPYDDAFQSLYLAYIAGITAFGLVPRATLEIPGGPVAWTESLISSVAAVIPFTTSHESSWTCGALEGIRHFSWRMYPEPFAVILSPPLVILSGAKDLALIFRV